jgi:hypothetical protein
MLRFYFITIERASEREIKYFLIFPRTHDWLDWAGDQQKLRLAATISHLTLRLARSFAVVELKWVRVRREKKWAKKHFQCLLSIVGFCCGFFLLFMLSKQQHWERRVAISVGQKVPLSVLLWVKLKCLTAQLIIAIRNESLKADLHSISLEKVGIYFPSNWPASKILLLWPLINSLSLSFGFLKALQIFSTIQNRKLPKLTKKALPKTKRNR